MSTPIDRMVRRASSYLAPQTVESRTSDVNPRLEVAEVNGRMQLDSANANYSFGTLHRVFGQALDRVGLRKRDVREALLLGLGGGSVLELVEERIDAARERPIHWTAVELDPVVIDLARTYFDLGRYPRLDVVCADASDTARWTRAAGGRSRRPGYDLIVVDVFVDDRVPPSIETDAFLRALSSSLAPRGLLLFNRLAHTAASLAETEAFAKRFRACFGGGTALAIQSNLVFVHESTRDEE